MSQYKFDVLIGDKTAPKIEAEYLDGNEFCYIVGNPNDTFELQMQSDIDEIINENEDSISRTLVLTKIYFDEKKLYFNYYIPKNEFRLVGFQQSQGVYQKFIFGTPEFSKEIEVKVDQLPELPIIKCEFYKLIQTRSKKPASTDLEAIIASSDKKIPCYSNQNQPEPVLLPEVKFWRNPLTIVPGEIVNRNKGVQATGITASNPWNALDVTGTEELVYTINIRYGTVQSLIIQQVLRLSNLEHLPFLPKADLVRQNSQLSHYFVEAMKTIIKSYPNNTLRVSVLRKEFQTRLGMNINDCFKPKSLPVAIKAYNSSQGQTVFRLGYDDNRVATISVVTKQAVIDLTRDDEVKDSLRIKREKLSKTRKYSADSDSDDDIKKIKLTKYEIDDNENVNDEDFDEVILLPVAKSEKPVLLIELD